MQYALNYSGQHANKVVSNSPGRAELAIRLVNPILDLPEGQVKFLGKFKLKKNCNQGCSSKILGGRLLKRLCNNLPEWQAIKPTFFAP